MIHVLNNLLKEYHVILDGLEHSLASSSDNELTIKVIREKLNHRYEKVKNKNKEKKEKEKAFAAYGQQYYDRCSMCGKDGSVN